MTQTDVDMGALVLKHELSSDLVNDILQVVQAAVERGLDAPEPFAMDAKGLRLRMRVVEELAAASPQANRVKPTAASVRAARPCLCVQYTLVTAWHRCDCVCVGRVSWHRSA